MRVVGLSLRDFRGYGEARVELGAGLTVITGPNGAGKTNLLEALYFGCTGRSCRTNNERELVAFGARLTRVEVDTVAEDGPHRARGGVRARSAEADDGRRQPGRAAPRRSRAGRWSACSFPTGSSSIKGAPALRRAHLDQFVQRHVAGAGDHAPRVRPGARAAQRADRPDPRRPRRAVSCSTRGTGSWPTQGWALMGDRRQAVDALAARFAAPRRPARARGRARAALPPAVEGGRTPSGLLAELAERRELRPRARVQRARPAPRRARQPARRPRPARLRLTGPAAARAAGAAARRARRPGRCPRRAARCCCSTT